MLQDGRPLQRVTVRELVSFVAATYPHPMPVPEALAPAGVATYADRRVDKLSGGQTRRVRFAVAPAGNPELIVLDEPTAALDVAARRAFRKSMRAYARRGNTVLFSTGVRLDAWQWDALTLPLWIGALPFTLLGIGNGYRLTAQGTGVVNVACLMGFAIVGGLSIPLESPPGRLGAVGRYTPAHRFADLGWAATAGHAPGAGTPAVLCGWLLLFGAYAVISYRRSARTV